MYAVFRYNDYRKEEDFTAVRNSNAEHVNQNYEIKL